MNELALIFARMGIDTRDVSTPPAQVELHPLHAGPRRRTLHRRRPLLPGAQAATLSYQPEGHPGRRAGHDGMGAYLAGQAVKALIRRGIGVEGAV